MAEATGRGRAATASPAYERIRQLIAEERCVVLDGGLGTELTPSDGEPGALDERLWATRVLIDAPDEVLRVHRAYVQAGCDVISTGTWGLASALAGGGPRLWDDRGAPVHWMDLARRGLHLAGRAVGEHDRAGECAVAFSLNGDLETADGPETARLLGRLFADEPEPPDIVLLETLTLLTPALERTVEALLETGIPVWLSFRRCRHGVCGVYGEHWGGPEGDLFGRAARRFEAMGVEALLINCIPPDHVEGMVGYLRDFCDGPLGVYPNLGYFTSHGWRFDPGVRGGEYADMALAWREEGAQIIGGCCGVRPAHIAAARERLEGTRPGHRRAAGAGDAIEDRLAAAPPAPWTDRRSRVLFPLPFPDLTVEPGVFVPGEPSLMAWRHLFREGIGARQRCLDVGCGTGILAVQLALNGAAHVRAIDIDRRAVANTLANAFRNGVEHQVSAGVVDLYPWVPEERYEVIVASLAQQPTDPAGLTSGHRPLDYWGRTLLDQFLGKLPEALAPEGAAYVVQLSVVSQQRTAAILEARGLRARVVDYAVHPFPADLAESRPQIARVEEISDAYHLAAGRHELLVSYLLEITAA